MNIYFQTFNDKPAEEWNPREKENKLGEYYHCPFLLLEVISRQLREPQTSSSYWSKEMEIKIWKSWDAWKRWNRVMERRMISGERAPDICLHISLNVWGCICLKWNSTNLGKNPKLGDGVERQAQTFSEFKKRSHIWARVNSPQWSVGVFSEGLRDELYT